MTVVSLCFMAYTKEYLYPEDRFCDFDTAGLQYLFESLCWDIFYWPYSPVCRTCTLQNWLPEVTLCDLQRTFILTDCAICFQCSVLQENLQLIWLPYYQILVFVCCVLCKMQNVFPEDTISYLICQSNHNISYICSLYSHTLLECDFYWPWNLSAAIWLYCLKTHPVCFA